MRMTGGFLLLAVLAAGPEALAAAPLPTPRPDDRPQASCEQALAGPDYVPGVDAEGRPVDRADLGAAPVPLPDGIALPLRSPGQNQGRGRGLGRGPAQAGRDAPYVALDGQRLDRLLNPATPCEH